MTQARPKLTVGDAAALAGVRTSTIRNWLKRGLLPHELVDGTYRIDAAELRSAKVLYEKQLLHVQELHDLNIDERDLARAIEMGAVVPTRGAARRFSLEDRDTLVRVKQGTWSAAVEEDETSTLPSSGTTTDEEVERRIGRWPALRAYITEHNDPFQLPSQFWETRLCPEFVPPAGAFRYIYGQDAKFNDAGMFVSIKRSEGWVWDDQRLRFVPESDGVKFVRAHGWTPGAEVPRYRAANVRWKSLRLEWEQAWFQRRRQLIADGIDVTNLPNPEPTDGRNRRALLRRYHEEHWSPSDLPDWFWDTDAPPPFEPPTLVARFEFGEQSADPSGQLGTWIRWTGMWQHPIGDPIFFDPANDKLEWVPGLFEEGSTPAQYEEENQEYDLAVAEWNEAYQRVQRLLHPT